MFTYQVRERPSLVSRVVRLIKVSRYELGPVQNHTLLSLVLVLETRMGIGNVPCGIRHIKPAENSIDSLLVRSGTAL